MYANNKLAIKILKLCEQNVHSQSPVNLSEVKQQYSLQDIQTCCRELVETGAVEHESRHMGDGGYSPTRITVTGRLFLERLSEGKITKLGHLLFNTTGLVLSNAITAAVVAYVTWYVTAHLPK